MSSMQDPYPAPQRPAHEVALRRHPTAAKRVRYGDDDDGVNIGNPRVGSEENASSAGMVGFIFSMVSIGLIVVVVILWIFLAEEEVQLRNADRRRFMLFWFMFLDVLSFFAALAATVMGARGMSRFNTLYRGWGMTALTLGIIEMIGTMIFFFVITCNYLLFEMLGGG